MQKPSFYLKKLLIPLLLVSLNSCEYKYPNDVMSSLSLARQNRKELIKVLEHYRNSDSLKYEAACYLIANMRYHKSEKNIILPDGYTKYFFKVDDIYSNLFGDKCYNAIKNAPKINDSIRIELAKEYNRLESPQYKEGMSDLEILSSDFLTDNIDVAFEEWRTSPFLKNMEFEEFKEVILPYRTTTESIILKRSELRAIFRDRFKLDDTKNIYDAIAYFNIYIEKVQRINFEIELTKETGLWDLFITSKEFNCFNNVSWYCNILKACGIPVVFEFTPQWPDRENRHFWAATPDSTGVYIPYSPPHNNLKEDWNANLQYAGVVYRKAFSSKLDNAFSVKNKTEYIPYILDDPFIEDQTFRYRESIDLELPFIEETTNNLAYLSYITRSGLVPVKYGLVDHQKKTSNFNQVPVGLPFVLSYYNDRNKLISIGDPFILEKEETISNSAQPLSSNHYTPNKYVVNNDILCNSHLASCDISYKRLRPSYLKGIELTLFRKYPLKEHLLELHDRFKDCALIASNHMNGNCDTLHMFREKLQPYVQHIDIKTNKKYKYFTIASKNMSILNIGHLEYLTLNNNGNPATEMLVYNPNLPKDVRKFFIYRGKSSIGSENAFDNDIETFSGTRFTTIEFNQPIKIDAIRISPRIANNHIVKGDRYALFSFEHGNWQNIDTMVAQYNYLKFHDVPANTLFLLRNLDQGREEMPFIYRDNKQVWLK